MLLEFKAKNYKSFKGEMVFSMIPVARLKGLDYSISETVLKGRKYKSLSSGVIYGPNAAGKTNVIGAMDTFKKIVLRGHINNDSEFPNIAAGNLELIPFFKDEESSPVSFEITFIDKGMLFHYSLSILIGSFLDSDFVRKILFEELDINDKIVFKRQDNLVLVLDFSDIKDWINNDKTDILKNIKVIAGSSLAEQDLFLTNGFKTIVSQKLVDIVSNWFKSKFDVYYRANDMITRKNRPEDDKKFIQIDPYVSEAAKIFGITSNDIGYAFRNGREESDLASILGVAKKHGENKNLILNAEVFESFGTIRFINEFPIFVKALLQGSTLVIDEFDASIHPMALMSIVNVFHNDSINIHHAQLIFNTHNPIFLNSNLFRRDEIKFVERNDETGVSELYQLSDFGTVGENGVRNGEDYMRNYFINRYGAIKEVDFSPLFEKIMAASQEEGEE